MPKLQYKTLPKKWKNNGLRGSFGLCHVCQKWKEAMSLIYGGVYYSLCERDYYDLFGDEIHG